MGSKIGNKNGAEIFHKLTQELIPYVRNSRSGKTLKSGSERTRKADLRPVSFCGSSEVPLPCVVQGRVRSKVRSRLRLC